MSALRITGTRVARDVLVQVGSRALNLALGVVVTAIVVRSLGEAGYGEWSTLFVVLQLTGYFMNFGMESVAVREAASDPDREGHWIGALLFVSAVMSIPVMLAALAIVIVLHTSTEMLVAGIVLCIAVPLSIGDSLRVVHQLRVRNTVPMVVLTLQSVLWGVAAIVIVSTGGGIVELAIAMAVTEILTATIQGVAALRLTGFRLHVSREDVVRLVKVSLPIGAAGLLVVAYARIDQVMVFQLAGPDDAGLYGAVYRLMDQSHFVPVSVITSLAPIMAASWPDHLDRMLRTARQAAEYLAIASFGGLAFAAAAADPLVDLFFGTDFHEAAPALPVLGGAFVIVCFGYLTGNLLLVLGLQNKMFVVTGAGLVANIVGNIILIPRMGFIGAAWMTLVTELVVVAISGALILRRLALPVPRPGRLLPISVAAIALWATLAALEAIGAPLAALVVLAAVLYPGLLFALRAVRFDELRSVLLRRPPAAEEPAVAAASTDAG